VEFLFYICIEFKNQLLI